MESRLSIIYIFFATLAMTTVRGGQPAWNVEFVGDSLYAISTETWEECGLLCTRNIQRLEEGLKTTKCSYWTWSDPSNREYNNVCRFHREDITLRHNGGTISGPTGCHALWNC